MKGTVIARLRQADQWLTVNGGAPLQWMRELLRDAAQELEGQSGALWCQWSTGRQQHVRIFVTGEMGPDELDSVLEMLHLTRSYMQKRQERAEPPSSVEPAETPDAAHQLVAEFAAPNRGNNPT